MRLQFRPCSTLLSFARTRPSLRTAAADSTRHSTCGASARVLPCAMSARVSSAPFGSCTAEPAAHRHAPHWLPAPVSRRPKRLTSSSSLNVAQHDYWPRHARLLPHIAESRIAHAMHWSRVADTTLGRRDEARLPSKLPMLDNHHLIGPGTFEIAGPHRRNIPERHHDPPGAPSRAFINATGPRLRGPAYTETDCSGSMCVAARGCQFE
ncbi:uncharacterized protein M421DRAFT_316091 [Didymella exigua CBS 183.55]|uniref:Uncharacterized protein n=1 Tax=Didymella exigua CBS 183.55 TaxID=1150837 RepID=A0A6A5RT57_9PLEO|nr:uncharacterized protein M421DRAFT_316091 [Didymella exigua CBS 183.55]KAF1931591.1 hypothetical protein M421DRAFT_316091 [Didymella exigua CBS 183.55]